jgi:hypothetical protein
MRSVVGAASPGGMQGGTLAGKERVGAGRRLEGAAGAAGGATVEGPREGSRSRPGAGARGTRGRGGRSIHEETHRSLG